MSSRASFRLPDLLIAVACVLLLVTLAVFALSRNRHESLGSAVVPVQLRSIHQAMLIYGIDNGNYLPGLDANGNLLTNVPSERYMMLLYAGYLVPEDLTSPLDVYESVDFSYAMLDIAEPGLRREAWTVDPLPNAVVLAERPGRKPALGDWAGWVMYHRATLGPLSSPVEYAESSRVPAGYDPAGSVDSEDDLFTADGPDDAFLIMESP